MYTFVVIGCERDLALLEFQAQSMEKYLTAGQDILLLINEKDTTSFFEGFDKFKYYYNKFNLTIKSLADFDFNPINPYVDQQVLKLAAAQCTDKHLLVLDCQNFLFRPYVELPILDEKIPYRSGPYSMHPEIWNQYCNSLGRDIPLGGPYNMSLCTPLYMHNGVIRNLIENFDGLNTFATWFRDASTSKSEFALYSQWCEHQQGVQHYHYLESDYYFWSGPYLRDHPDFDVEFNSYLKQFVERIQYQGYQKNSSILRNFKPKCCWSSINHRAWGDMSDEQFDRLTSLLNGVMLNTDCLNPYRKNYVHVPI